MLIIGAGGAGTQMILDTKLREMGHCVFVNTDAHSLAQLSDSATLQPGARTCAGMPAKTLMRGEKAVHESLSDLEALLLVTTQRLLSWQGWEVLLGQRLSWHLLTYAPSSLALCTSQSRFRLNSLLPRGL